MPAAFAMAHREALLQVTQVGARVLVERADVMHGYVPGEPDGDRVVHVARVTDAQETVADVALESTGATDGGPVGGILGVPAGQARVGQGDIRATFVLILQDQARQKRSGVQRNDQVLVLTAERLRRQV